MNSCPSVTADRAVLFGWPPVFPIYAPFRCEGRWPHNVYQYTWFGNTRLGGTVTLGP